MSLRSPIRRRLPSRAAAAAVAAFALGATAGASPAAAAPHTRTTPGPRADPQRDAAQEARAAARGRSGRPPHGGPPADRVRGARERLTTALGRQGVLDVDPLSGTVTRLQRLDGALTDPSSASAASIAKGYVREHATALGLTTEAADALTAAHVTASPSGLRVVRLEQAIRGVPLFDGGLEVGIDRAGRVLTVHGTPRADLPAALPAPALSATQALERLMDASGGRRAVSVAKPASGPRRTTRFSTGDTAELVLFGARTVRLAWHLTYRASDAAWFDAVVDAESGDLLHRANLVERATAELYDNYPGAPVGGSPTPHVLDDYLSSPTTLAGPFVHAYADVDDDDMAGLSEEVDPHMIPSPVTYPPAAPANTDGGCDAAYRCTWDHTRAASWTVDRAHAVAQAFWFANRFHDHLAAPPIGFSAAEGAFQGDDALQLEALDGAATAAGMPDADHRDNASMATPPDGTSPQMEMYLWAHDAPGAFRDVHGGDDPAIVDHEYAHGLTSRLVTTAAGTPALHGVHAAAMGEGWSDWYAMDELVRDGLVLDDPAAAGDVDLGRYVQARPHEVRTEATDCRVGSTDAAACPGAGTAGAGGYTFGDFGRIANGLEPHADGEIWGQTLWDLRRSLVDTLGSDEGAKVAEQLVTDGLRLTPAEPSFLDARNAILAADVNATGGANAARIWEVFRARGMGFYAAADDGDDAAVVEDFSAPPAPGAPRGSLAGTVISGDSGLPIAGTAVGVGGLDSGAPSGSDLKATTAADGRYAIGGVPAGTYPKVRLAAPGYDTKTVAATVAAGQATTVDAQLERDWAAAPGGATLASTSDDAGAPFGCGGAALIDQGPGRGWSAVNTTKTAPPQAVVELPVPIAVEAIAIDPRNVCGDGPEAATRDFLVETSSDGTTWQRAVEGHLAGADLARVTRLAPTGGAAGVRFVRLTLLAAAGDTAASTTDYVDVAELSVYGRPPNVPPSGTLTASQTRIEPGTVITLDASSFHDPDSAIASYAWDFDGNGSIERTTAEPRTDIVYRLNGAVTPTVTAHDFRGGTGSASTPVDVAPFTNGAPPRPKPHIVIPRTGSGARIRVRVTCVERCRLSGTVAVQRQVKRKARLGSTTVLRQAPRSIHGTRTITLKLSPSMRARLRHHGVHGAAATVALKAAVIGDGPRTSARRTVRLRL